MRIFNKSGNWYKTKPPKTYWINPVFRSMLGAAAGWGIALCSDGDWQNWQVYFLAASVGFIIGVSR